MLANAPIPEHVLTIVAAATLFVVMLDLGLDIVVEEFCWVLQHPGLLAKGLFSALVAVPAIALAAARAFDLPREADVGIVLMAISPGAPVALRRSLDAGGHRSFAPALQILVTMLAVVSMPMSVAAIDEIYGLEASIAPGQLARQVLVAQFLPLGIGMLVRRVRPALAVRVAAQSRRLTGLLLVALTALVLIDVWKVVVDAGPRIALTIALVTVLALAVGHHLGGPEPGTRSAVAITSALRNPGLALLVATLNTAPTTVVAMVFAYLVVSGFIVLAYALWRRRAAVRAP